MPSANGLSFAPWTRPSVREVTAVSLTVGARTSSGFFDAGGALTVHNESLEHTPSV